MSRSRRNRKLNAEMLEARQLLHGGGFSLGGAMRGGEPPSAEDVATAIVDRLDADDDGAVVESEASERMWTRLSAADADGNGAVTAEELAAQVQSRIDVGVGQRPGRTLGGRGGRPGFRPGGRMGGHNGFDGSQSAIQPT